MPYRIVMTDEAVEDLRRLNAFHRTAVKDAIMRHLRHQPAGTSKSRIKRIEDIDSPEYRLRVGDLRIYYDIVGDDVVVLAILFKKDTQSWLRARENPPD